MASRLNLHEELVQTLGSRNVYYQPPATMLMLYPAIRYSRTNIHNFYADGKIYRQRNLYEITVIDENPDSVISQAVSIIPGCKHLRSYTSDGLNHDVFSLYY